VVYGNYVTVLPVAASSVDAEDITLETGPLSPPVHTTINVEMPRKIPPPFRTRRDIERYFGGKTIECLLCGRRFRRLVFHLFAKHDMTAADYKSQFGLPWTRGLTSAVSHANSGWTDQRRARASKAARKTRFFEFAHQRNERRELAPFLKMEAVQHLGKRGVGFGEVFDRRVRRLFENGLIDADIARILRVNRMTVNLRTKHWRRSKNKK
jgi:predicted transcriptional regulator